MIQEPTNTLSRSPKIALALAQLKDLNQEFADKQIPKDSDAYRKRLKKVMAPIAAKRKLPPRYNDRPIFHFGGEKDGQPFNREGITQETTETEQF